MNNAVFDKFPNFLRSAFSLTTCSLHQWAMRPKAERFAATSVNPAWYAIDTSSFATIGTETLGALSEALFACSPELRSAHILGTSSGHAVSFNAITKGKRVTLSVALAAGAVSML